MNAPVQSVPAGKAVVVVGSPGGCRTDVGKERRQHRDHVCVRNSGQLRSRGSSGHVIAKFLASFFVQASDSRFPESIVPK
jgi:hypothetical protein